MTPPEELEFEEALLRLESLVGELEGGELGLEESLRKFEEGVRLVRQCSERLEAARLRIRQLEEQDGELRVRELDVRDEE